MTTTAAPADPATADGGTAPATAEAVTPTLRETLRRRRAWIVIAAVLVLGALVVLVVQGECAPPGRSSAPRIRPRPGRRPSWRCSEGTVST